MPNTTIHFAYLKFHQLSHLTFLLVVLGIIFSTTWLWRRIWIRGWLWNVALGVRVFSVCLCSLLHVSVELAWRARLCFSLWPTDSFLSVEAPLVNCLLFGRSPIWIETRYIFRLKWTRGWRDAAATVFSKVSVCVGGGGPKDGNSLMGAINTSPEIPAPFPWPCCKWSKPSELLH